MGNVKDEASLAFLVPCPYKRVFFTDRTKRIRVQHISSTFPSGEDFHLLAIRFVVPAHWAHQFIQLTF